MNIEEFKEKMEYYLNKLDKNIITNEQFKELNKLKRVIELLEEDVIVKTEHDNYFFNEIDLNLILRNFNDGNVIIKLSEV